jgi:transposase
MEKTTGQTLFMAIELSLASWRLGFSDGGMQAREVTVDGGDMRRVAAEITKAKRRFGLTVETRVRSGYEAGRDGFWLHRFLTDAGVDNVVMDSASIEVDRRSKQTKSDGVDLRKLLSLLVREHRGERSFRAVRVPSREEEDERQLHRGIGRVQEEKVRISHQIRSLLFTLGIRVGRIHATLKDQLDELRTWEKAALPPLARAELERLCDRLQLAERQLLDLELQQRVAVRKKQPHTDTVSRLVLLRGVGVTSAWLFAREFFDWRRFTNRKQVAACAGLAPAPYQSGQLSRDQGITKAGNRRVRTMAIEVAWGWLKHQPDSVLSKWFNERFGKGKRSRRIGIVALARRLLVALWRYADFGVVPQGALLKA